MWHRGVMVIVLDLLRSHRLNFRLFHFHLLSLSTFFSGAHVTKPYNLVLASTVVMFVP